MNKVECLIVRRIAVKMKKRQGPVHAAKHKPIAPKKKRWNRRSRGIEEVLE
jgi:hypothetical protein